MHYPHTFFLASSSSRCFWKGVFFRIIENDVIFSVVLDCRHKPEKCTLKLVSTKQHPNTLCTTASLKQTAQTCKNLLEKRSAKCNVIKNPPNNNNKLVCEPVCSVKCTYVICCHSLAQGTLRFYPILVDHRKFHKLQNAQNRTIWIWTVHTVWHCKQFT